MESEDEEAEENGEDLDKKDAEKDDEDEEKRLSKMADFHIATPKSLLDKQVLDC